MCVRLAEPSPTGTTAEAPKETSDYAAEASEDTAEAPVETDETPEDTPNDTPKGTPDSSAREWDIECASTVLQQTFDGEEQQGSEWSTWREEDASSALKGHASDLVFGGYIDATGTPFHCTLSSQRPRL